MMILDFKRSVLTRLQAEPFTRTIGSVDEFVGNIVESSGPDVFLGEICEIYSHNTPGTVKAEVVGFKNGRVQMIPFGNIRGIHVGSEVLATSETVKVPVGDELLGKIIDPFGRLLVENRLVITDLVSSIFTESENPLTRPVIKDKLNTSIKIMDSMLPIGKGQKIGIFSGSGVGKSTLLGMLAGNMSSDVNVIALIGERGREVREFVDEILGPEGQKRSIVVVAKSDDSALARAHAAFTATTIAEYFANKGKDVLLMMDSLTRYAIAQREIGLSVGEPPTSRGYTPSVFTILPKLIERAGTFKNGGSITGIYTVLVEGDDINDPISDYARATLDGHIILSRTLANNGIYPAIDLLNSKSRLINRLHNPEQHAIVDKVLAIYSEYNEYKDMISIGAYKKGTNQSLDKTVEHYHLLKDYFKQNTIKTPDDTYSVFEDLQALMK